MVGVLWSRLRNSLYDHGILKSHRFPAFTISVGNLTWGGTGKTSLVQELSLFLLSEGLRVAILSRGYRRRTRGPLVVSDGQTLRCSWKDCGDEPFLLASELPQAIVVVAEKRAQGMGLIESFHPDVILLDDAFQHRKIERDIDILLIDASEDICAQRVIPFGKLREERGAVSRAGAVLLTHFDKANRRTIEWVELNVKTPVFRANYVLKSDVRLVGRKIGAFCAIGSPHHFYSLLREQGADLVATKSFADHHIFAREEVEQFLSYAKNAGAETVMTTAKDSVRLPSDILEQVQVIRVKLQIHEESLFFAFLSDALKKEKTPQTQ